MNISSPTPSRVRLLFGSVSILFVLVAFSGFMKPAPRELVLAKPGDGLPGQPEANPAAMDAYVQQIDFGAGADTSGIFDGALPCGNPDNCGGKSAVRLRIVPSNLATNADWDSALGNGNGYIVAKITNLDSVPFDRLNLGAGEIAYVWIGDSQGVGRAPTLYTVRSGKVKRLFKFKGRTFCRDSAQQKPAVHIYTPTKCTDTKLKSAAAATEASIEPISAIGAYLVKAVARMIAPPPADSGLWISCSLGCCEAQF